MSVDKPYNGMPATCLHGVTWIKSRRSNPNGSCVEFAELSGGTVAIRNSRDPQGPALICTREQFSELIHGIKDGELDNLARLCRPGLGGQL